MSETSPTREIEPQTTLRSYTNVLPKGYQEYLRQFLEDERKAIIDSTREKIQSSTIDEISRDDNIPFVPDAAPTYVSRSSEVVLEADPGEQTGRDHIQRAYNIYPDHRVAVLCYGDVDDASFAEYSGSITTASDDSLTIELDIENSERASARETIEDAEMVGVASIYNPLVFNRERQAIDSLPEESSLWGILIGERAAVFEADDGDNSEEVDEILYQNQKQSEAIEKSLSASDICCVRGPPGTGKTRVIVEIARRFAAAGNSVLITAETNTAVDNILMGSDDQPTKTSLLGQLERSDDGEDVLVGRNNRRRSNKEYVRDNVGEHLYTSDIMLSTNNSAQHLVERGRQYDVLISDEAAQARKTSSFIPMQLTDRAIFIGDDKQLSAGRQSRAVEGYDDRHKSVFHHTYGGMYPEEIGVQLNTQFRMVPELLRFSNDQFYEDTIETAVDHESEPSQPIGLIDIDVAEGERTVDTSRQNQLEATAAVAHVKMLLDNYFDPGEIGIIAAYSAQEELIRWQLDNLAEYNTDPVQVATIDRFQGSEKEAIVVSFTRSNEEGNVGFLSGSEGPNRLNVALTRARQYCALIGDWGTLRAGEPLYDALHQTVSQRFETLEYTQNMLADLADQLARQ